MLIDVRAFQISRVASPEAEVAFSAKILARDGKIIGTRAFKGTAPVQRSDVSAAATALNQAFGQAAVDLVVWGSVLIRDATLGGPKPGTYKSSNAQQN